MITRESFGSSPDGDAVDRYTLVAGNMTANIMTYGGVITHLHTPDRRGEPGNIVLGYDDLAGYIRKSPHFGAITGRVANRIAGGTFTIDGTEYSVDRNKGSFTLHGGSKAFDRVNWIAEASSLPDGEALRLRYRSPDGDQGFPGALDTLVTYTVRGSGELRVDYEATTDRPTLVNLTQHSYFNLSAFTAPTIRDHLLTLHASRYTPIDTSIMPTGTMASVADTPLDFRTSVAIGARIEDRFEQLTLAGGYDHNFVIDREAEGTTPCAHVEDPLSGRTLTVFTTEPGVQLYTGNSLDGSIIGSDGRSYGKYAGFCLETQHYPDAPHHPQFPSIVLRPGERYTSHTVFRFGSTLP